MNKLKIFAISIILLLVLMVVPAYAGGTGPYDDFDGDGIPNCEDPDIDGDGYSNEGDPDDYNPEIPSCYGAFSHYWVAIVVDGAVIGYHHVKETYGWDIFGNWLGCILIEYDVFF